MSDRYRVASTSRDISWLRLTPTLTLIVLPRMHFNLTQVQLRGLLQARKHEDLQILHREGLPLCALCDEDVRHVAAQRDRQNGIDG
jgi:hypothetical protein